MYEKVTAVYDKRNELFEWWSEQREGFFVFTFPEDMDEVPELLHPWLGVAVDMAYGVEGDEYMAGPKTMPWYVVDGLEKASMRVA